MDGKNSATKRAIGAALTHELETETEGALDGISNPVVLPAEPEQPVVGIKGNNKPSALDELFLATVDYRHSKNYEELLQFISRFPKYAPFNCFLLYMQNPEISYVATPGQWHSRFERTIKAGARALVILAPMGPVVFVYDLADTDGKKLPRELERPFETRGQVPPRVWDWTVYNSEERDRIAIVQKDFSPLHAGTAKPNTSAAVTAGELKLPAKRIIELNNRHTRGEQYSTLVHELAHIHCGHVGGDTDGWWPDRRRLTREQMEFEAESVSYLVCRRLQLETTSARYLAGYAGSHDQIPVISFETVLKVAGYVESLGRKTLQPRKEKRKAAKEVK